MADQASPPAPPTATSASPNESKQRLEEACEKINANQAVVKETFQRLRKYSEDDHADKNEEKVSSTKGIAWR